MKRNLVDKMFHLHLDGLVDFKKFLLKIKHYNF